jgi:hypothetical protein
MEDSDDEDKFGNSIWVVDLEDKISDDENDES